MMKTRQDLIAATLKKLNALAAGQSPEAEDVQTIEEQIDGKLSELNHGCRLRRAPGCSEGNNQ